MLLFWVVAPRPRQGAAATGRWRSTSRGGSYRALPGYAHVDADRLTTSRDAEERRRTRGPWTDGMVFSGAGHTAAGPRRQGGQVICCFYLLFWLEFWLAGLQLTLSIYGGDAGASFSKITFLRASYKANSNLLKDEFIKIYC